MNNMQLMNPLFLLIYIYCDHLIHNIYIDWVTQDLMTVLQSNPILSRGFQNPACMAAVTLMQKNPTEALTKFRNDPEVTLFLQEFGRVMGSHFESLGQTNSVSNNTNSSSSSSISSAPVVQELGPLHAQAITKSKADKAGKGGKGDGTSTASNGTTAVSEAEDARRVKEVRTV